MDENYKATLGNKAKSFRLIKTKSKQGNYAKSTGVLTNFTNGLLFFPIATDTNEIADAVYSLFGIENYSKFIKQYFFPKRIIFKPSLVPGPTSIINTNVKSKKELVMKDLPRLKQEPGVKYMGNRNLLVDYSKVLDILMIRDEKKLKKDNVRKFMPFLLPEILTYFVLGDETLDLMGIKHAMNASVLANSPTRDFLSNGFDRVIFTYKIQNTDALPFTIPYLMGKIELPRKYYFDPVSMYTFSLIRFIIRTYASDYESNINSGFNSWMEFLRNSKSVFYFYNDNWAFAVDMKQLTELKWNDSRFIKTFANSIRILIKNNTLELTNEELEAQMIERNEEENEEAGIIDEEEDKTDISTKAKIEAPKFPNISKEQDNAIAKLINNILIKEKSNPDFMKTKVSVKKEMRVAKAYKDEYNELMSIDDDDKYIDSDYLKSKKRLLEADNNGSLIEEDEEITPFEEGGSDEETAYSEINEEELMNSDDIDEEIEEPDMPDATQNTEVEADLNQEMAEDAQTEVDEEEKKAILKSIEKENKPKKTPREIARIKVVKEKYKSIKTEDNRTIEEILEDVKATTIENDIKEIPHIKDKSLQKTNVFDLEKSYVEKTMKKDTISILKSFSEDKTINLHMIKYEKSDTSDAFNERETYRIVFEDETQKRHTLRFDIPKVDENGRMKINGNTKILKKQLILKPIVKLGPDSVWITSQFNKVLLTRKGTTINRSTHVLKSLLIEQLQASKHVKIQYGNATNHNKDFITSVEYDDLAAKFVSIDIYPSSTTNRVLIMFSQQMLREEIKKVLPAYVFKDNVLPLGIDYGAGKVIDVDITAKESSVSNIILDKVIASDVIPDLQKEVNRIKVPKKRQYTDITLQSKSIPLIVFLAALFGLQNVIQRYKVNVELRDKIAIGDRRPFIKFKDYYMYYEDYPLENALLLNGLTKVNTEEHNYEEYNDIAPYIEFLYKEYKSANIYKGWTSFKELFIDPVTKELLQTLELPTDFLEIFLYANDLLGDNQFYHETDLRNYRVRGYEMVNEYLYKALATQYITLKQMKNPSKMQFSVPQDVVISKLYKSPLLAGCDITNPLNEMKEKSIISYKGTSGVNLQEAFKMEKRSYNKNSMGVIGIASVDNAMVGITKELTMDCNIVNTRGFIDVIDDPKQARELSCAKMCTIEESFFSYMMKKDDPNRIGFACNQTIHTEECDGSSISLVGTGLDKVAAYKCPSTFAQKSKEKGTVIAIDEEHKKIMVEYKSGNREVYDYGLKLNRNSNYFLENNLECAVKVGQKLEKGDIITYNPSFFEYEGKDIFMKMGVVANVAIFDGFYTDDDSTLVSANLSERMNTSVVMRKQIALSKSTNLIKYSKIGDEVLIGQPLMVFEDTFDDTSSRILGQLDDLTEEEKIDLLYKSPKANATGKIVAMDVYWTIPLEEMRPSLRDFVMEYQRKINKNVKLEKQFTGKESNLRFKTEMSKPHKDRIEGVIVPEDGGVIVSYYISHDKTVSLGDKISINSSLKSIVSYVTPAEISPYRENGPIDVVTSYIGICKRQINSIYNVGALGKILFDYGKREAKKYLGIQ